MTLTVVATGAEFYALQKVQTLSWLSILIISGWKPTS